MIDISTDDILKMKNDTGLHSLLDLNHQVIDQGQGYWVKIQAWEVAVTEAIPHGIRYSMTLHDPLGTRIMGYDNAHGVKLPKKFKYSGNRLPFDHRHRHTDDAGVPYEFKDAYQLLSDFFSEVDAVLNEIKM